MMPEKATRHRNDTHPRKTTRNVADKICCNGNEVDSIEMAVFFFYRVIVRSTVGRGWREHEIFLSHLEKNQ